MLQVVKLAMAAAGEEIILSFKEHLIIEASRIGIACTVPCATSLVLLLPLAIAEDALSLPLAHCAVP